MATLEERLERAERSVELMAGLLTDIVQTSAQHPVAIQMVLRAKGMLTDEEVDARLRALQEFASQELTQGHDPRYDRLRQLRQLVPSSGEPFRSLGDPPGEEEDELEP